MERLLNIEELAQILGITEATIYAMVHKKKIPFIKLSRKLLRFKEGEIMEWIKTKTYSPLHAPASHIPKGGKSRKTGSLQCDYVDRIVMQAKKEVLNR